MYNKKRLHHMNGRFQLYEKFSKSIKHEKYQLSREQQHYLEY